MRPGYTEAHNNLGNVLMSLGRLDEAAAHYQQALSLKPDFAEAHNNLGNVLLSQGEVDQAATQFEQACSLKPDYTEAHNNLGTALLRQSKLDAAAARFERAISLRPDYAEAHNNLGSVLWRQGRLDDATARFNHAIALRPDYAEAHNNLGIVLAQQSKFDPALQQFERAIALRTGYAEAHNNLGNVLSSLGNLERAVTHYERALAIRPNYIEVHSNLGNVLWKQGKLDEAAAHSEHALALKPDYAEAHNNLGNVLLSRGKLDEAKARFEQALALKPDYAEAHNNLGDSLIRQGKVDEAQARFEQALALKPDLSEAELGLATCCLVKGDYERGWPAYEARLRRPGHLPPLKLPRWTGQDLAGRSLLLLTEQGFGDTIHFVRYARLLKERGAGSCWRVRPHSPACLHRVPICTSCLSWDRPKKCRAADYYLPLLSAPGALGTTAATIPGDVPYLAADAELTERWRRELAGIDGFKIAIVWQGSRGYSLDRQRSIPLAQFAPLARLPGVRLLGLQKGFGTEQIAQVDFPVLDLSNRLDEETGPFMDTAAVLRSVDLVVAPDTAIAQLAGALRRADLACAFLFGRLARGLREEESSLWYPTARLFRQAALGEWPSVFERMAAAVQARLAGTT